MQRNPDAFKGLNVSPDEVGRRIIQRNPDMQSLVATESPAPATTQPRQPEGFIKSLVKAPIKTLLVKPAARTAEALSRLGVFGKQAKEGFELAEQEGQDINLGPLGRYQIEPVKPGVSGVKQITGEGLETASYLAGGAGAAAAGRQAVKQTFKESVKTGLKAGAKSGSAFGAGTALQEDLSASEVATRAATGAAVGAVAGAAVPAAVAGAQRSAQGVKYAFGAPTRRAAERAEQEILIRSGVPESSVAGKKLSPAGKVVDDPIGKEAIRQGLPEADVALIKVASSADKSKMRKMLNVREKQFTNKRITERATDVVGDTFIEKVAKPIQELNKAAAKKLDVVAQKLGGKRADPSAAISHLGSEFDRAGIKLGPKGKLDFVGSDFEGLKTVQSTLENVWNRAMRLAKTRDALQMHRAKRYIDNLVEYGAEGEGLKGNAERILKGFRRQLDTILDKKFRSYNEANTVFSETINELNNLSAVLGKRFRLTDNFADAQAGLGMRRILSNTQSRAEVLKLIDSMQNIAKKYGIKIDEDVITQANFADILERELKSEAPTSFLGQIQRGVETFGSTPTIQGAQQAQQVGSTASEFARGNVVRGTIKAGAHLVDVLRNVNQRQKIKAIKALLDVPEKKLSVFGKKR